MFKVVFSVRGEIQDVLYRASHRFQLLLRFLNIRLQLVYLFLHLGFQLYEFISGECIRIFIWDEHHQVVNRLESLLPVSFGKDQSGAMKIKINGVDFQARGDIEVKTRGAQLLANAAGAPPAYLSQDGKGKVLYFPFRLGSVALDKAVQVATPTQGDGPTADSGERASVSSEFSIGRWLKTLLQRANLSPSYQIGGLQADVAASLRIEQPMVDERGNCAVIVTNRAGTTQEIVPPSVVEMELPAGAGSLGLWASADDDELREVRVEKTETVSRLHLPEIRTAGVLYLFKNAPPLLGITKIQSQTRAADGATAQVKPGRTFKLTTQVFNVSEQNLSAGELRIQVPEGWMVKPALQATSLLGNRQRKNYEFEVAVPTEVSLLKPNWIYPLVVRWHDGQTARSVITTNVEVEPATPGFLRILSDNASYPATYPYLTRTGAAYSYADASGVNDPASGKTPTGKALLNGYNNGRIGMRYSGSSATEHLARFEKPEAKILFDLKDKREVRQVVVPGPGQVFPNYLKVFTSLDEKSYQLASEMPLDGSRQEIRTPLFSAEARFVRLEIGWLQGNGTLDEVEILGR